MPLYTIATRKPLSEKTRFDIAQAITDVHCELTGAPPEFVNVIFMTGYRMKRGTVLGLNGNVRVGGNRNDDLYKRLNDAMHAKIAATAQLKRSQVLVTLIGVEYHWIVEGGMPMPAPGEEAGWLERKNAYHASLGIPQVA
ncbi:hypothetical protein AAFO92_00520 [Roseovarius sp. CAU 1744]|uniref:hypothetical protein n=1 Tax=Roseovarius sp. CAU 1744 TaxID=3140368 RepID=UPI00325A5192